MKHMTAFIRVVLTLLRHASLRRMYLQSALLAVLSGLLWPLAAVHAHTAEDVCTRSPASNQTLNLNMIVNIGRDAQINDAIGPWFSYPTFTWTCKRHNLSATFVPPGDRYEVKTDIGPDPAGVTLGSMINVDGQNYQVYRLTHTSVGPNRFGYIARIKREFVGGSGPDTDFVPITATGVGTPDAITIAHDGGPRAHGETFQFRITLQLRLVKLHDVFVTGLRYDHFLFLPMYFYTLTRTDHDAQYWKPQVLSRNRLKINIKGVHAACTTPQVDVPLGDAHSGNLQSVGDAGPIKDFNLRFENCPAYMHSVAYRFQSMPLQAISNGTLPLDPVLSTASGVGVQVLNADETPLAFNNTFIPLTDYDAMSPSPVYLVPMKARIIRMAGALQGGSVHAAMKMLVRYQ